MIGVAHRLDPPVTHLAQQRLGEGQIRISTEAAPVVLEIGPDEVPLGDEVEVPPQLPQVPLVVVPAELVAQQAVGPSVTPYSSVSGNPWSEYQNGCTSNETGCQSCSLRP
jgi:hypothetical protein